MKTVLVTGSSGFIGKNLCAQLSLDSNIEVIRFDRTRNIEELDDMVSKVDFVFHLAGINRPVNEREFETGNKELTSQVVEAITKSGRSVPLLLASSIQAELDNPYGKSKKAAEDIVLEWSGQTKSPVFIFRLPNVFGKWCKPDYNSVVATFCNNIANEKPIQINDPSKELTLVYIDDVVSTFVSAMKGGLKHSADSQYSIKQVFTLTLQDLARKIKDLHAMRTNLITPDLHGDIDRYLYATYTSYLPGSGFAYELDMKRDDRGWLAEFIKSKNSGQVFISKTKPGIVRGNHWHHTKIEKFLVIDGQADIKFRKYDSTDVITYEVSGEELRVVDIPAGYLHSITNTGTSDLTTIFWADEIFNPERPDTHYAEVEK